MDLDSFISAMEAIRQKHGNIKDIYYVSHLPARFGRLEDVNFEIEEHEHEAVERRIILHCRGYQPRPVRRQQESKEM